MLSVEGDQVTFETLAFREGVETRRAAPFSMIAGVLPGGGDADEGRDVRYLVDVAAQLDAMEPGQSKEFRATETSTFDGVRREEEGLFRVTLQGCGQLTQGGATAPVQVFDVHGFGRTIIYDENDQPLDTVVETNVRRFVDSTGIAIREQSLETTGWLERRPLAG